jgi:GNAT superfamily N-acetyltransferase
VKFTVTQAMPEDVPAIAGLFREMDDFYGEVMEESVEAKSNQISSVLFADPPLAYALLARADSDLVGFAAYSFLWPAIQTTKSLYLKELYVAKSYRHLGVGKMLIERTFKVAVESGCSRAEWTTDKENTQAQEFYASLGLANIHAKIFYRVEGHDALRAASRSM